MFGLEFGCLTDTRDLIHRKTLIFDFLRKLEALIFRFPLIFASLFTDSVSHIR